MPSRRKMQPCLAALLLGGSLVPVTGARAQVPLSVTQARHIPARPPSPDAVAVVTRVANGTRFGPSAAASVSVPVAGPLWRGPVSFAGTLLSYTMPGFATVGPAPILNASGGFETASPVAGRITGIAVDPADTTDNTFYIAAAGGGVWKTTNGGASFTALTDSLPDTAMGSIAIDPRSHLTLYAGSGEASFSGDARYGLGLYKSADGGSSWTVYTGPGNAFVGVTISRIVVDPTNSSNVYLTTARGAQGNGGGFGVYRSANGGVTWTRVFSPGVSCTDLAISATNPQILYAAVGEIFGSTANGIYETTNGGTSWALLTGFPNGTQSGNTVGRITMALAPSNPSVLYADYSSSGSDFGGTRRLLRDDRRRGHLDPSPDQYGRVRGHRRAELPGDSGMVRQRPRRQPHQRERGLRRGRHRLWRRELRPDHWLIGSFNGGATWYDYSIGAGGNGPHTDHHALTFTPDGSKLLNGNDGGLWRLETPNVTPTTYNPNSSNIQWTDLNTNLGITQFTGVALHPTDPTIAYGGSQDNGTEKYTGSTQWTQVRGGDGGFTHVDQSNPNTVYHEYYDISLERSDNAGNSWTSISGSGNGINPNDPSIDGDDPAAFYVPYVLDPLNQQRIIYGTNHVYESTNKGTLFTIIGTPAPTASTRTTAPSARSARPAARSTRRRAPVFT